YLTSTGYISLEVKKAIPKVSIENQTNVTLDQIKTSTIIVGGNVLGSNNSGVSSIVYISSSGVETDVEPTAPGEYTAVIRFAGDANYEATEYRVTFNVPSEDTDYTIWIIAGVLIFIVIIGIVVAAYRKRRHI
ncbi:MAG: hypothetical protein LBE09_06845, partial [Christensenellaceae bacterium]|nr:hypothetical protein [Christensenellaceae bacterium]